MTLNALTCLPGFNTDWGKAGLSIYPTSIMNPKLNNSSSTAAAEILVSAMN